MKTEELEKLGFREKSSKKTKRKSKPRAPEYIGGIHKSKFRKPKRGTDAWFEKFREDKPGTLSEYKENLSSALFSLGIPLESIPHLLEAWSAKIRASHAAASPVKSVARDIFRYEKYD